MSACLFQIAREKLCYFVLIIYMERHTTAAVAKENLLKTPATVWLANFQIFKFCSDIQGSHSIGYLWVSSIIDQSEYLI